MTDAQTAGGSSGDDIEDKKFDAALNSMLQIDKKDYPCYVGGLMVASGEEHMVKSPVDESIQFGRFQEPEEGLTDRAVEVALDSFKEWSKKDPKERTGIFEKALDVIKKQRYRIAAAVTLSCGMTREDSLYEADRMTEIFEDGIEKIKEGADGRPTGVWAVISEYNSPLAAPIGYSVCAMLAGNTVVLIPPKECPFPVYMLYEILTNAGLPDGVLNVIYDRRGKATNALTENEDIAGIAAIGRGDKFEDLMFSAVNDISFVSEFKGMNPLVIYKPSSMQTAADIAIRSAFRYCGQRIDSSSKAIITMNEQKQFIDHLLVSAKKMIVGDPADKGTFTGPIISKENMDIFLKVVKEERDNLIFGGKRITNDMTEAGFYVMPAIFAGLPEEHELNEIDHSLPILTVQVAGDLDEAIEMANDCEFGMSMGIVSKDEKVVERFLAEAGSDVVYVNGSSDAVGTATKADVSEFLRK